MSNQDDLFAARALRDDGIARATEHADAVEPAWSEVAYAFAQDYARKHPRFTSEDVREASAGTVPTPPSLRAWGGIFMRLAKSGQTERAGYDTARDPKVHCNVVTVWRSLTYQPQETP